MRPSRWGQLLSTFLLLLSLGCEEEARSPSGPFVPLADRLPADASLVVLVDLSALSSAADRMQREIAELPLLTAHPKLKAQVGERLAGGRSALDGLAQRLGLGAEQGLRRAALAMDLSPAAGHGPLLAIEGEVPAGALADHLPQAAAERIAGHDAYPAPPLGWVTAVDGRLLLAGPKEALKRSLTAQAGAARRLAERHPDLFSQPADDFVMRASMRMQADLARTLENLPLLKALVAAERFTLEAGREITLSAVCKDERGLGEVRALLEAQAELLAGGQHLIRGLGFWLLMLDSDGLGALDDLPAALRTALDDKGSLLATLNALFPDDLGAPPVRSHGRSVELVIDAERFTGTALLAALAGSMALPERPGGPPEPSGDSAASGRPGPPAPQDRLRAQEDVR